MQNKYKYSYWEKVMGLDRCEKCGHIRNLGEPDTKCEACGAEMLGWSEDMTDGTKENQDG